MSHIFTPTPNPTPETHTIKLIHALSQWTLKGIHYLTVLFVVYIFTLCILHESSEKWHPSRQALARVRSRLWHSEPATPALLDRSVAGLDSTKVTPSTCWAIKLLYCPQERLYCVYVWARNRVQHQHHVAINTMSYWLQNQTGSISTWAPNHCWSWMLTLWPHAERWRGSKKSMCLSEINKGRGFVYQLIVTPKRCTLWKGDCLWEHQRSTSSFVRCTRTHAHAHFDEPHLETYSYSTEYSWQREPYNVG